MGHLSAAIFAPSSSRSSRGQYDTGQGRHRGHLRALRHGWRFVIWKRKFCQSFWHFKKNSELPSFRPVIWHPWRRRPPSPSGSDSSPYQVRQPEMDTSFLVKRDIIWCQKPKKNPSWHCPDTCRTGIALQSQTRGPEMFLLSSLMQRDAAFLERVRSNQD